VVAEGVEDQEALDLLKALSCDFAQGYHISRPLPADQVERRLLEALRGPAVMRIA
jgi:EAL domain-containing protein (putative c-di-GMP-specific phosphodiesterase class I)